MPGSPNPESDVEDIARGYLRCSDSLSPENFDPDSAYDPDDPDERAYEIVHRAIREGPAERAWELVTAVLRLSPDERLGFQAAGPLEDIVRRWGTELVGRIEAEAAADERFRWALGGIWVRSDDLPSDVTARIVAASGDAIKLL